MVRFSALARALAGLFLAAALAAPLAVTGGASPQPSGGAAGHRLVAGDQGPGKVEF